MDEFLLKFDLSEIEKQISEAVDSYEKLGSSVKEVNKSVLSEFKNIKEVMSTVQTSVDSLNMSMGQFYDNLFSNLKTMSELFGDSSQSFGEFLEKLKEVEGKNIEDFFKEPSGTEDIFTEEQVVDRDDPLEGLSKEIDKLSKKIEDKSKESKNTIDKMHDFIKSEAKKTKAAIGSTAKQSLPGVTGAGLAGGLIGMMILGIKEKFRIKAEAGEMLNVFEAAGEDLSSFQSKIIVENFSRFQEKAQWFYGISRKEIQGVVKQAVEAGHSLKRIHQTYDEGLGEVGESMVHATLALDKHLNQASGTQMKNAIDIMTLYGDTMDEAVDKTTKIGFAAQRSGIGIQNFTNAIYGSASALSQYGIDMKDVVNIMSELQGHYEGMGLGKQYAGRQAALGLQGIAQGIAGMSDTFMTAIAREMFPDEDVFGARVRFRSGWTRAASGEDAGFLTEITKTIKNFVERNVGRDREKGIEFLMKQGMNFEGATALIDIADKLDKNNKLKKLSEKELERLRKAFQTEGEQVNELLKVQRELIIGLRKIGEGILQILAGISGTLVMAFKGLKLLMESAFMKPDERKEALQEYNKVMDTQVGNVIKGFENMGEGFGDWASSLGKFFTEDLTTGLKQAIDYKSSDRGLIARVAQGTEEALYGMQLEQAKMYDSIADIYDFLGFEDTSKNFLYKSAMLEANPETYGNVMSQWWDDLWNEGPIDARMRAIENRAKEREKAGYSKRTRDRYHQKLMIRGMDIKQSLDKVDNNVSSAGPGD